MGVSLATANPQEFLKPAAAVPGTGAQVITLFSNTQGWAVLIQAIIVYVATITTGGITPTVQIVDAAGNVIWQSAAQTAIAAGTTGTLVLGGGLPASSTATFDQIPIPNLCMIPPGGKLQLTGSPAAATDTVAAFGVYSY